MKASIIIPTYNAAWCLADAVESVWNQTRPADELIIVDDCSRDDTMALAATLASRSPIPMRVMQLDRNSGGPAKPTNFGIRDAQSEVVGVLDQDDVYTKDAIQKHLESFTLCPEVSFSFGLATVMGASSLIQSECLPDLELGSTRISSGCSTRLLPKNKMLELLLKYSQFVIGFPGFFFSREKAIQRPISETLRIAGDFDFLCSLSFNSEVAYIPEPVYHRRVHNNNLSNDSRTAATEIFHSMIKFHRLTNGRFKESFRQQRNWLLGRAYWLRKEKRFAECNEVLRVARKALGLDAQLALAMCKLKVNQILHWAMPVI
jgi:glycosyltransferase involved in cell wall biosynthesis